MTSNLYGRTCELQIEEHCKDALRNGVSAISNAEIINVRGIDEERHQLLGDPSQNEH